MAITWASQDRQVGVTWTPNITHGYLMETPWISHEHHMVLYEIFAANGCFTTVVAVLPNHFENILLVWHQKSM